MNLEILAVGLVILLGFLIVATAVYIAWAAILTVLGWHEDRKMRRRGPW